MPYRASKNCSELLDMTQTCPTKMLKIARNDPSWPEKIAQKLLKIAQKLLKIAQSCSKLLKLLKGCSNLLKSAQNVSKCLKMSQNGPTSV